MKKQVQLLLSAIFMVWMSLAGYGQNVGSEFTVDEIKYKITAPTAVEIVDYLGTETEVTIPQTVNDQGADYEVTAIGNRAFHLKELTKVTFSTPSNVTSIGQDAFFQNQLTGVLEIPESVTDIGQRAFGSNKEMTEVTIPNGVTRIEQWAFAQNGLTKVTIPASVESIGKQAFFANNDLDLVTIKRNPPPTYEADTFQARSRGEFRLINFDLRVPFEAIEAYENAGWTDYGNVTSGITSLEGVIYGIIDTPNEVTVIGNIGVGFNVTIPPTVEIDGSTYPVTAIGDDAFRGIGTLVTITIQGNVKRIGFQAFHSPRLNRVTLNSTDPPMLDADAFEYPQRHDKIKVIVPKGRVQAYKDAGWTGFNDIFSLIGQEHNNSGFIWEVTSTSPNEVKLKNYIGLSGVPTGGHVEIPSEVHYLPNSENDNIYTVTAIGDNAMRNTDSRSFTDEPEPVDRTLNTVQIPESVTKIGEGAFADNQLTHVDIPDGVTYIGESAFERNQLTEVNIPGNVKSIGKDAFWQNQLSSVEISESVTSIGQRAFGHNELTEVIIPDGVTRIEQWIFSRNKLTKITIPANVEHIGYQAFFDNQLTEVTISGSLKNIDLYAFQNNPDLHLMTVEANDPPSLHEDTFTNPNRDQIDLVIPTGKKQEYLDNGWHGFRSISNGIFTVDDIKYGITSRTEVMVVDYIGMAKDVSIPETVDHSEEPYIVTTIKENAFQNKELASIEIPSAVISIGELAFGNNQLTAIAIPNSVERIDSHAFYNNPDLVLVTVEANDPPVLHATAFANANRHQIDLVVPTGRIQAYKDNGWGGFRSISISRESILSQLIADFNRGFSPNADGIADTLVIEDLEKYKNNVVKIYNLSQRLLFSAHYGGPNDAWDGTYKGSRVPVGSYVCVIDYNEPGLDHEAKMIYVNY